MSRAIYIITSFCALLLLQVLVLNNIQFLGFINPYLYIAFVFTYPFKENKFGVLSLAFLLGLCVDFFTDTGGIHAFSTVFIAFIRLALAKKVFQKSASEFLLFRMKEEEFGKVFNYVVVLTLIHHFVLFALINFSFHNFSIVLINTISSSIFTLILYFLGSFIFKRKV